MGRRPVKRPGPHPVDVYVGGRVRLRRIFLGYSQEKLGQALGLTFQQIQKYERGINRISASTLYELSRLLDVSMEFFFEGAEGGIAKATRPRPGLATEVVGKTRPQDPDVMARRETILLVSRYYKLPSDDVRREILGLLRSIAEQNAYTNLR
jgi:transcriptional regulator with XRE-family HTH domain